MSEDARTLEEMIALAARASAEVKRAYAGTIHAEYKGPEDPVTEVDRRVNELLVRALEQSFPGVPIVAEESAPSTFDARRDAGEVFFVDPIDGTREFIEKNGEFCVMIGLARRTGAALGVIDCPANGRVVAGGAEIASFELAPDGSRRAVRAHARDGTLTVAVSRTRFRDATKLALARLGDVRTVPVGSAGIKTLLACTGEVDAYVHLDRAGCLWDACAGDAIAKGAGGVLTDGHGEAVDYARGSIELSRGVIVAEATTHASIVRALQS